ncbi:MAG: hypothetical protein AB7F35_01385 [Acetobacteraceae bacterium]
MSASDDDVPEAIELEQAAEWRLRKVDADPGDERSAAAARQLQKLADEVRQLRGSPLYAEYLAICNWLGESDGISEFALRAQDFRAMLGFGTWADSGEGYLRALIEMAKETFGTG